MRLLVISGVALAFCCPALADDPFATGLGLFAPAPLKAAAPQAQPTEADARATLAVAPVARTGECPALTLAPDAIKAMVEAEAARQKVDVKLALAIARQESGFGQNLNSPAGAHGVMQLMPETVVRYHVENVCDASENIRGGDRLHR